jgi:hypothetical protein
MKQRYSVFTTNVQNGFGLDTKYGPRPQKNGGFLIMLAVHLMAVMERNVF